MRHHNYNIDVQRTERLGFPEVVFGQNKDVATLHSIISAHLENGESILITRLQAKKHKFLYKDFPGIFYDPVSSVCIVGEHRKSNLVGTVGIISAGTSDEYVVNEAYYCLQYLGVGTAKIQDVGVAGIHRLFDRLDDIKAFDVLIVVAGFEGALPTAIGGLVPQPIIAVPTSVGTGVAHDGTVALHSMLSSCANGISVVNIDNGYGAAMAAFRILNSVNNK
ncbi:MAG: 1-(5-phosphoribosyl)-5-amino-4-imidazole-carboxyl ate carboxylase [Cyclobacteriaceae bacterium]|nr:MAG: 1-(5-phosphoribosyl)-5-amino-4-imidazole-carboxyl ate carboxylase [Cyclobacteriaceae bacterium]